MGFKPNSTPQNRHPSYQTIFISCVGQEISGWFVSGPISDGTKCPRKFTRIDFNFSDTMLEVDFKLNLTPQNRLVK